MNLGLSGRLHQCLSIDIDSLVPAALRSQHVAEIAEPLGKARSKDKRSSVAIGGALEIVLLVQDKPQMEQDVGPLGFNRQRLPERCFGLRLPAELPEREPEIVMGIGEFGIEAYGCAARLN